MRLTNHTWTEHIDYLKCLLEIVKQLCPYLIKWKKWAISAEDAMTLSNPKFTTCLRSHLSAHSPFVQLFCQTVCLSAWLAWTPSLLMKHVSDRNAELIQPWLQPSVELHTQMNRQTIQQADKHTLDTFCYMDTEFGESACPIGKIES